MLSLMLQIFFCLQLSKLQCNFEFFLQNSIKSAIGSMASASSTASYAMPLNQFGYIMCMHNNLQVIVFFLFIYFTSRCIIVKLLCARRKTWQHSSCWSTWSVMCCVLCCTVCCDVPIPGDVFLLCIGCDVLCAAIYYAVCVVMRCVVCRAVCVLYCVLCVAVMCCVLCYDVLVCCVPCCDVLFVLLCFVFLCAVLCCFLLAASIYLFVCLFTYS